MKEVLLKKKIILTFSIFLLFSFFLPIVSADWWDSSWLYKQPINISVASGSTPQDYQVEIKLNSSNVGAQFDWNSECEDNASRIRFLNSSENSELSFWVKECSSVNENMIIWVKVDNNITTTLDTIYMYYGNIGADLESNGTGTFDLYLNFSDATMTADGSQDAGNGEVLDGGRIFHTWGNAWKVFTDFGTFNVKSDGSQMLEQSLNVADCGEITSTGLDTDTSQRDSDHYKWCGSQGYGNAPDQAYNTGSMNTWQDVYAILNDFSQPAMDNIHFSADDDGDASTNYYAKDVRIRKYVSPEPVLALGTQESLTTITSLSPADGYSSTLSTVTFNCSAISSSTTTLTNITLYGNWSGGWHANETKSLTGTSNSTTFTKNLPSTNAIYSWNCLVYDDEDNSGWYTTNYTFSIDTQAPDVTIKFPIGTMADVTPLINLSFGESIDTAWYNIDNGINTTLCTSCTSSENTYLHLAEGSHTIYTFANDSAGNVNKTSSSFTIDMNENYYDNFNDNSSVENYNDVIWSSGNLSFTSSVASVGTENVALGQSTTCSREYSSTYACADAVDGSTAKADSWITPRGYGSSTDEYIKIDWGEDKLIGLLSLFQYTDGFSSMSQIQDVNLTFSDGSSQTITLQNNYNGYYDYAFDPVESSYIILNPKTFYTARNYLGFEEIKVFEVTEDNLNANFTFYSINTTNNITSITNVTWTEYGTDANNNISVEVSADNGQNWHTATSGSALGQSFTGANNSLIYRVLFATNSTTEISLLDMNISWSEDESAPPEDTCTPPGSGNWGITCSDNCVWDSDFSVPGNITMAGSGTLTWNANMTFTSPHWEIYKEDGCQIVVNSGGSIK